MLTLDRLIAELEAIRKTYGGDLIVKGYTDGSYTYEAPSVTCEDCECCKRPLVKLSF